MAWDALLTDEEKNFLAEWHSTADLTKLCPEDVKKIVQILKEVDEEAKGDSKDA